jgi:hypothetical protein
VLPTAAGQRPAITKDLQGLSWSLTNHINPLKNAILLELSEVSNSDGLSIFAVRIKLN